MLTFGVEVLSVDPQDCQDFDLANEDGRLEEFLGVKMKGNRMGGAGATGWDGKQKTAGLGEFDTETVYY